MRYLQHILTFSLLLLTLSLFAQEQASGPDLQTVNDGFFDPTRKPDKLVSAYRFGVEYRLELGYDQSNQRVVNDTLSYMYLHGARLGATFQFMLPLNFSLQTGLLATLRYGHNEQHWRSLNLKTAQTEFLDHRVLQCNLVIPVRAYYTIPLYQKLNLFFYTGPQLNIGLVEHDFVRQNLSAPNLAWMQSQSIPTEPYDKLAEKEYLRTNIQYGLGGGLEWDRYRLQAGYDFGLNNRIRHSVSKQNTMWEWSWYTSFSYRF